MDADHQHDVNGLVFQERNKEERCKKEVQFHPHMKHGTFGRVTFASLKTQGSGKGGCERRVVHLMSSRIARPVFILFLFPVKDHSFLLLPLHFKHARETRNLGGKKDSSAVDVQNASLSLCSSFLLSLFNSILRVSLAFQTLAPTEVDF